MDFRNTSKTKLKKYKNMNLSKWYDFYFLYLQGPFYFNMQISVSWKTEESVSRKGRLQENDRALTREYGI